MIIFPFELEEEYWVPLNILDIKPNVYEITNYGNVRRIRDKYPIKAQILFSENGAYRIVNLANTSKPRPKKYLVHRLVAMLFVPNPYGYPYVNHMNNNGMDETYRNLSWATPEMNNQHQWKSLKSSLSNLGNYKIYSMINEGHSDQEIIREMNSHIVDKDYIESIRQSWIRNNPISEYNN